eukprot:CAMPEP_0179009776 /NCGR_PEP_ID=MMETSP0795-20121207/16449_1 /TAXON_ID=88552 /ORGANISM="Amoebophrya sp., Strain Ameob2" /LENGTH=646 /DNA_ID=CAMNT_0020704989 /DNA_START=139 /DNA_END=2079 /DNA_ORIENTATION=+
MADVEMGDAEMQDVDDLARPLESVVERDLHDGNKGDETQLLPGAAQEQVAQPGASGGAGASDAPVAAANGHGMAQEPGAVAAPPSGEGDFHQEAAVVVDEGPAGTTAVTTEGAAAGAAGGHATTNPTSVVVEDAAGANTNAKDSKVELVLQPNEEFTSQYALQEGQLDNALLLAGLDQCTIGQIWACFNGKVPPGTVTKVEFISDPVVRIDCRDAKACNDVIELITVKYVAPDGVEKEENEGPGIWRCRNHYVELKRATPADVKPEGWKKKTRSGRTVKEYRGDVKWCGEQGIDTNFATKLALKARAVEEWQHLTNEDQPEVNLEQDIISSTHLLDMMSKKDEKAYTALEVKGVPSAQKGGKPVLGPGGPTGTKFGGKGKGPTPNQPLLGDGGSAWGGNFGAWEDHAPVADHGSNREMEGFLDFLQEGTEATPSLSGYADTQSMSGVHTNSHGYSQSGGTRLDPYGTPQQRMEEFDRHSTYHDQQSESNYNPSSRGQSRGYRSSLQPNSDIDSQYGVNYGHHEVLTSERRRFDDRHAASGDNNYHGDRYNNQQPAYGSGREPHRDQRGDRGHPYQDDRRGGDDHRRPVRERSRRRGDDARNYGGRRDDGGGRDRGGGGDQDHYYGSNQKRGRAGDDEDDHRKRRRR